MPDTVLNVLNFTEIQTPSY